MLSDLFHALRRGPDQLRYFRHTYSPFSPWRAAIAEVTETAGSEASRYGATGEVDPRRVYQVARMVVSNRHGEHLSDLLPDAWLVFSPPSAAGFHNGKRQYDSPVERRKKFLRHPQTLAYLLCPPALSRAGVGASVQHGVGPIREGEQLEEADVVSRLEVQAAGKLPAGGAREYAGILLGLAAGIPEENRPSEDGAKAA